MGTIFNKIEIPILLFLLFSAASCKHDRALITGNLVSLDDGYVSLYTYEGGFTKIDSTFSHNGRFSFEQPDILPDVVFVNPESLPEFYIPVVIEGRDVYISGNLNYRDDIQVSGTEDNDLLRDYFLSIHKHDVMMQTLDLELQDLLEKEGPVDSLQYRRVKAKQDEIRQEMDESRIEFVRDHPSSIVSAMFLELSLTDSMNYRQVDSLLQQLDSTLVDNAFSQRLRRRLEELKQHDS